MVENLNWVTLEHLIILRSVYWNILFCCCLSFLFDQLKHDHEYCPSSISIIQVQKIDFFCLRSHFISLFCFHFILRVLQYISSEPLLELSESRLNIALLYCFLFSFFFFVLNMNRLIPSPIYPHLKLFSWYADIILIYLGRKIVINKFNVVFNSWKLEKCWHYLYFFI